MKRYCKYNPTCIFFIGGLKVFLMKKISIFDIIDRKLDIIRIFIKILFERK